MKDFPSVQVGRNVRLFAALMLVVAALGMNELVACGAVAAGSDAGSDASSAVDAAAAVGTEGGVCYGNMTCHAGLTCLSNVCVSIDDAGAPLDASAIDASMNAIDAGPPTLFVFVSEETYAPPFDPTAICQSLAIDAGLGGTWAPWIALDAGEGGLPTAILGVKGVWHRLDVTHAIVGSADQLTSGALTNSVQYTQHGQDTGQDAGAMVWTGITADLQLSPNCGYWTTEGIESAPTAGSAGASNGRWTDNGFAACTTPNHIYCFQIN